MTDETKTETATGSEALVEKPRTTLKSRLVTTATAVAIIAGVFGSVNLLAMKAAANKIEGSQEPLPVATSGLVKSDYYMVPVTFTGSIEASQQSSLSFQVAGEVEEVLVEEGDVIKKGQTLARLDTDRLEATISQLKAQVLARKADLELAQLTEKRQEELVKDGFTSKQRFDELRLGTLAAEANLAAAEAALQSAEVDLDRSTLVAPFDGIVAARRVDAGAVGLAGTQVLDLIETSETRARIGLPPEIAKTMSVGDTATLTIGEQSVSATVRSVRPDIEPTTRSQAVVFTLNDKKGVVSYGDIVRLKVEEKVEEAGYWVPANALRAGEKGLWLVYLLMGETRDVTVRPEAVEILFSQADRVYVRGNLPEGATLVASGLQRIAPGQLVRRQDAETSSQLSR